MKRALAYVIYFLGIWVALRSLVLALSDGQVLAFLLGIAGALAAWWIAAGFGVRLRVSPDDLLMRIKYVLGGGIGYEMPVAEQSHPDNT